MDKKIRARNIELIRKYKEYREKGLTYSEITTLMGKQKRQFVRWNDYIKRGVLSYPQVQ